MFRLGNDGAKIYLFCTVIFFICSAHAAMISTWNGGTSGTWATADNWTPSTSIPGSAGESVIFPTIGIANRTINYVLDDDKDLGSILFNGDGGDLCDITITSLGTTNLTPTLSLNGPTGLQNLSAAN
ncbi:MAG: hypothetical protein ACK5PQ_00675 [Alphaproteobacteria bacterium]